MSTAPNLDVVDAARADIPGIEKGLDGEKRPEAYQSNLADARGSSETLTGPNGEVYPTEEELTTLRRTHGKVSWLIYSIGFVEMCERFAYYGTTAVCKSSSSTAVMFPSTDSVYLPSRQLYRLPSPTQLNHRCGRYT